MIMVGLVFRSLCMKLTSINQRKKRVRGGLKQIAESMNYVTRSMSNDLDVPDSPRSVLRTYSNRRGADPETSPAAPRRGEESTNNNLSKREREDLEMQMIVAQTCSIPIPGRQER